MEYIKTSGYWESGEETNRRWIRIEKYEYLLEQISEVYPLK